MNLNKVELLQTGLFVDGQWIYGSETYPVTNPANGSIIANVSKAGREETLSAIEVAQVAFKSWRRTRAKERSKIVRRWGDLMLEHQHDLATILTSEQGKPFTEALCEVEYAAGFLEWFAEEAKRVYGDVIPSHKADARILITKEPIGVVGAITPWNFPLAMVTRKAGPAIAAGCSMVLKPSEETPLSALALATLAEEAGVPAGVFNVLSGDAPSIGGAIMDAKVVRKLSFTGSTRVGKLLMRQAADTVKKLSLELGGNAPFIVFDDADVDAAVMGAIAAKFRNTGQTCVSANRLFVQDAVYEEFTRELAQAVSEFKVSEGFSKGACQGPLINQMAHDKVQAHVADAVEKGGEILAGGKPSELGGTFYLPTVIGNANTKMMVANEETFGPVAACYRFSSEEEVLNMANETDYGLSAYFYSRDIGRIWRFAEELEAGIIGINEGAISTEVAPFGGIKESGIGREGSHYGIDDYVEIKYMLIGK